MITRPNNLFMVFMELSSVSIMFVFITAMRLIITLILTRRKKNYRKWTRATHVSALAVCGAQDFLRFLLVIELIGLIIS